MIQVKIKNNCLHTQMEKIHSEDREVDEAFEIAKKKGFKYQAENEKLAGELFDKIQACNQMIRMLFNETNYNRLYKAHINKLQGRANCGLIVIDEYIEV